MTQFNPEWTTEEAYFWERHMEEYSSIWWNVPTTCGHPGSGDGRYVMERQAFIQCCTQGHETIYPVLVAKTQDLPEDVPL